MSYPRSTTATLANADFLLELVDYLVQVQARDMEDYERIHNQHLSRLPGVVRLHSSFAMRSVIARGVSPAVLNG